MSDSVSPADLNPSLGALPAVDLVEALAQNRLGEALFGISVPVRVGRYVVLEHLGSGGFGDVYTAFDSKLNRKVALKLLRSSGGRALTRMLREAQALARVAHPNVVAVFDAGTHPDDHGGEHLYIAMEHVEGSTLRQWLVDRHRSWREVLAVTIAAGRGLEAVHNAGLVHQDFKPANMLLGADGRVRVVDFGLARLAASASDRGELDGRVLEVVGRDALGESPSGERLIGTPAYMAPEQHARRPTDARSDMFAFAITTFEALYGTRPHRDAGFDELGATKLSGSIVEVQDRGVPSRIRSILRRALAGHPEDRYRDMGELLAALERRPARRWLLAAAVVLGAAVGASAMLEHQRRTAATVDEVEALTVAARAAAARALFVYPPLEDPAEPTAYQRVRELEALSTSDAELRGNTLRREFADTLVRLGDRYWDAEGGRGFALDYYVEALVFDPEQARATERATVSLGRLVALEQHAAAGSFSAIQLEATEPLLALAAADPQVRGDALAALIDRPSTAASVRRELAMLLATTDPTAPVTTPVAATGAAGPSPAAPPADPPTADTPVADPPAAVAGEHPSPLAGGRDIAGARSEVVTAQTLVATGDWRRAAQAFHRALELDDRHVAALAGLASLYFELRYYGKARQFGRKAVKLAPKDPQMRIVLGDAAFGLQDYAEARRAYQAAADMGSEQATRRLESLAEVVGVASPPP